MPSTISSAVRVSRLAQMAGSARYSSIGGASLFEALSSPITARATIATAKARPRRRWRQRANAAASKRGMRRRIMSATPVPTGGRRISSWRRSCRPRTSRPRKRAGIRTIINNRPDGEAADQLTDAEARALAAANGLDYVFVPVVSGRMGPDEIAAFAGGDRRPSRPASRLLPLRHALLPHVGVRHGRASGRSRRRSQPAAAAGYDLTPAQPDPGAPGRRLSVRPQPAPGTVPRRPAPAAGRTVPRSRARSWPAADERQAPAPAAPRPGPAQGRLSSAEPGARRRQQLGVAQARARRGRAAADRPSRCRPSDR